MNPANQSRFVYVTYIRTTPGQLWQALTDPQRFRQYRFDTIIACNWKQGSAWKMTHPDNGLLDKPRRVGHARKEIDPPRRMVICWQNEWQPAFQAAGPSRCTIALAPEDHAVKLPLPHAIDRPVSPFIPAGSDGWPRVLANRKSLLETGQIGW